MRRRRRKWKEEGLWERNEGSAGTEADAVQSWDDEDPMTSR